MTRDNVDNNGTENLDHRELKDARRRSSPKAAIVYEAIRREGEEALGRSLAALVWSGFAAGLSMGFSFLTEALLALHLPKAQWTPLIAKFGYCAGFLIVILGRQQLFTENTLTPMLQLFHRKDQRTLAQVGRLWSIVFCANLAGALLFALLMHGMVYFRTDMRAELVTIGMKVYTCLSRPPC